MKAPAQILYVRLLLAVFGGLFCAALSYFHWVQPLDRLIYDLFNEVSPMSKAEDIVIVAIDESSLQELGRWPWPREKHVELLRQLQAAGVAIVAMDILFAEANADYPQVDDLLSEAIQAHGTVVLPVFFIENMRDGKLREVPPIEPIAGAAAALGHVHIELDSDGVARSVFLREGVGQPRWVHFAAAVNGLASPSSTEFPGVVNPSASPGSDGSTIVRDYQNLIPFMGPAGTVNSVSYVDVMKGRAPHGSLRDKIVLVGATAAGHVDNITTSLGQISGVEINANILHALRTGNLARPLSTGASALVMFIIAALSIVVFTRMAPGQLLLGVLCGSILLPLASLLLFYVWRLWISPAPIVLTLVIAYPLWNWLRLDAAVDFIGEQLQNLEKENLQLAPERNWSDIESAADFLVSLGHVSSWRWQPEDAVDPHDSGALQWSSGSSTSSRCFTFDGQVRRFLLHWIPGHEAVAGRLPQIFPESTEGVRQPGSGADFVNLNLLALDNAYAQARRNRDLVQGSLQQLESAVILSELSGELVLINEQARLLLGLDDDCKDLLLAMRCIDLVDRHSIEDLVNALIFRGLHFDHEGTAIATGREVLCRGGVINLDHPMLLIVIVDISDLKTSEKRRVEALNFLSHDLRAPLTSVLALIESSKEVQSGIQDIALLDEIEGYIQRNLSYAENFIQLAKLEHDESLLIEECDASSLIDNAVAQLFHMARKKGVEMRIEYCEEEVWLDCNRALLERALINLIDNALKHSATGNRITVASDLESAEVIFRVSDQGRGIPAGDMERIFGGFEQGADASDGVGLGLRFVYAVARSHGGSVSVENNPACGACFTISLPCQSRESATA